MDIAWFITKMKTLSISELKTRQSTSKRVMEIFDTLTSEDSGKTPEQKQMLLRDYLAFANRDIQPHFISILDINDIHTEAEIIYTAVTNEIEGRDARKKAVMLLLETAEKAPTQKEKVCLQLQVISQIMPQSIPVDAHEKSQEEIAILLGKALSTL